MNDKPLNHSYLLGAIEQSYSNIVLDLYRKGYLKTGALKEVTELVEDNIKRCYTNERKYTLGEG